MATTPMTRMERLTLVRIPLPHLKVAKDELLCDELGLPMVLYDELVATEQTALWKATKQMRLRLLRLQ